MSIIYNKLNNDFTQISNTILTDTRVSALAFKIYCYICYRINISEKWEFYNEEIVSHFKEKIKAFLRAKNELLEYGYLQKVKQNKGDGGRFKGCDYIIYKEPLSLIPQNGSSVRESSEKGVTNNKDKKNKDLNNKDCIALQGQRNFSKNDVKENSTPKELQNWSKNVEEVELTFENFKNKHVLISSIEPKRGWDKAFLTFKSNYEKLSEERKKTFNGWTDYLVEWIANDKFKDKTFEFSTKPSVTVEPVSEPLKVEMTPEEIKLRQEHIDKESHVSLQALGRKKEELNEFMEEVRFKLKTTFGEEIFFKWFQGIQFLKWENRVLFFAVENENLRAIINRFYYSKVEKIVTKLYRKFDKRGFAELKIINL